MTPPPVLGAAGHARPGHVQVSLRINCFFLFIIDATTLSVLRPIARMLQMQFSMARRKFPLWPLRRCSVKLSKMRNFTFVAPWPEKTKKCKLGANQYPFVP
jgi:hypothetical protein